MRELFVSFFVLGLRFRHILEFLAGLFAKSYSILRVLLEKQKVFFLKQRL